MKKWALPLNTIISGVAADCNFAEAAAEWRSNQSGAPRCSDPTPHDAEIRSINRLWKYALGVVAGKQVIDSFRANAPLSATTLRGCQQPADVCNALAVELAAHAARLEFEDPSYATRLRHLSRFTERAPDDWSNENPAVDLVSRDLTTGIENAGAVVQAIRELARTGSDHANWPLDAARSTRILSDVAGITDEQAHRANNAIRRSRVFSGKNESTGPFDIGLVSIQATRHGRHLYWRPEYRNIRQIPLWSFDTRSGLDTVGDLPRDSSKKGACPGIIPFRVSDSATESRLIAPVSEALVLVTAAITRWESQSASRRNLLSDLSANELDETLYNVARGCPVKRLPTIIQQEVPDYDLTL